MKHALNWTFAAVNSVNGSVSVDQADALRAGAELLRLLDGRADVYLISHPPYFLPTTIEAQVVPGADAHGAVEQDDSRLDGLLVAMSVLEKSFTVKPWPGDAGVQLTITTVLSGVEVTVWTRIAVPFLVAYVRSWFPDDAEQADPFGQEPSARDLAAIEAEWPLIAAEVAVVDLRAARARRPIPAPRTAPDEEDETDRESVTVERPPLGSPVDPPDETGAPAGAMRSARAPMVPGWLRSCATIRAAARQTGRYVSYVAGFHSVMNITTGKCSFNRLVG